jgi:hypothetical protein
VLAPTRKPSVEGKRVRSSVFLVFDILVCGFMLLIAAIWLSDRCIE